MAAFQTGACELLQPFKFAPQIVTYSCSLQQVSVRKNKV